jgi:hypothetical protein
MEFGCVYLCFFQQFGLGGSGVKLCDLLPLWDIIYSVVKSETDYVIEAEIGIPILEVQVFAAR